MDLDYLRVELPLRKDGKPRKLTPELELRIVNGSKYLLSIGTERTKLAGILGLDNKYLEKVLVSKGVFNYKW